MVPSAAEFDRAMALARARVLTEYSGVVVARAGVPAELQVSEC